jgi:hypothetical protein
VHSGFRKPSSSYSCCLLVHIGINLFTTVLAVRGSHRREPSRYRNTSGGQRQGLHLTRRVCENIRLWLHPDRNKRCCSGSSPSTTHEYPAAYLPHSGYYRPEYAKTSMCRIESGRAGILGNDGSFAMTSASGVTSDNRLRYAFFIASPVVSFHGRRPT